MAKCKRAAESVLLRQQYVQLMTVLLWMSCMLLLQHSPHGDIAKHAEEHPDYWLCAQILSARQLQDNIWLA